jgi:hypothetical protein
VFTTLVCLRIQEVGHAKVKDPVASVLSIRNGGRVFLPANKIKRGLENPRSVKDHMIEFQRINPYLNWNFILNSCKQQVFRMA